jgi:hypothetical protein
MLELNQLGVEKFKKVKILRIHVEAVEQNYLLQMKNLIQDVVGHHFGHLWLKKQLWNYLISPLVKKELKFVVPLVDHT